MKLISASDPTFPLLGYTSYQTDQSREKKPGAHPQHMAQPEVDFGPAAIVDLSADADTLMRKVSDRVVA